MCGIAGIVVVDGFDPALLISMTHAVKHRGPDGFGFVYFDLGSNSAGECFHDQDRSPSLAAPSLGLGTRRLAILDLSESGNQPMQIEDGEYWITYNGEVYNYREIRKELEAIGHNFRTKTDTEVVLRAYSQWDSACVNRFNGMWSFAIWDRRRRQLFCSRDRFGVKPFYYFATPSFLAFGSEIKQLLHCPGVPRTIDQTMASQYLQQGLQDHTHRTFFADICQLPGGHSLTVDLTQPTISIKLEKYWDLPIDPGKNQSDQEASETFLALFQTAVTLRLRSDVPVGSCLSGGLDSSSIVTTAARTARSPEFHTFSSCFEDEAFDERQFIREVVSASGVIAHYVFPKPESFWDDLNCLIWHQDEPVGGAGVYAQWCVMQAARQAGIPVLLDGQGGDEILCGYRKFYLFYLWHLFKRADPRFLMEGAHWMRHASQTNISWNSVKRYSIFPQGANGSLLTRVGDPDFALEHAASQFSIGPGVDLPNRQKDDLTRYSLPALLHYEDRNSMAHSVEARVPMLDYKLAVFAVNCRPSLKLRDGWTKWILRDALNGTLPDLVRLRKSKLGFAIPQKRWIRQDIRGTIRSVMAESTFKMNRILSAKKVRHELSSFLEARPGCLSDIEAFRVLNLELWARVFDVQ
jgi:asparagine synthase (glutamine-hydrolysing)